MGIASRLFLKNLVAGGLHRVDQFEGPSLLPRLGPAGRRAFVEWSADVPTFALMPAERLQTFVDHSVRGGACAEPTAGDVASGRGKAGGTRRCSANAAHR